VVPAVRGLLWCLLSARWHGLSALCAFTAVEELGEVLDLVGVDPDDDPGLTSGLLCVGSRRSLRLAARARPRVRTVRQCSRCGFQARRGAL